ncbi:MAG: 30S ribosomal protein S6 [Desulfobacteraceae bacterium IS3]|nr:MAG: 30S ribosomal protein S6 [Desulfobacteraceae bacterium IS3]
MKRYETTIIIDPDVSDENRDSFLERIKDLILQKEGFLVKLDKWGVQKLAYEIGKKTRGYYTLADYCGTGALVAEMERFCRIDDRVLKYMTILLEAHVDLENLKKKMAEAEAQSQPSAAPKAEAGKAASPDSSDAAEPKKAELSDNEENNEEHPSKEEEE